MKAAFLAALVVLATGLGTSHPAQAGTVEFRQNQLHIDGVPQPQLYGAEVQYFRLRGGNGRNIPRETVIALWEKALDRFVEAKMNAISFYIPWDFHEYAEGRFDFDGTADEDGDGRPDYPSRDVKTFIRMIEARGIRHIMARPGPYINAEWGFLGFGAIPLWFHDKYPDSHAVNPQGLRSTVYSYSSPDLLRHARLWLQQVHAQVLKPEIGPGRPVSFIQLDNETNFMWQSLYNHDYGPRAVGLYRDFLKERYVTLENLNGAHGRQWGRWNDIVPPGQSGLNVAEDQDWYRFQDKTIHRYLHEIRKIWESLGVREPQVLFILAESYNSTDDGLLPHYTYRNDRGVTGMMTVNLYPKTYEMPEKPLLNLPFKADLDVKSADTASDFYLGSRQEWVMGPEIQGGWWPGIEVTDNARRQTYLTTLGHGMKALFIYYFNEGNNWQNDWAKNQIAPYYEQLRAGERYRATPEDALPTAFWDDFTAWIRQVFFHNWDSRHLWLNGGTQPAILRFDAPLDENAEARAPYGLVREIGRKIMSPYGEFLGAAVAVEDPVCLLKDSAAHAPSPIAGMSSRLVSSDWSAALLAYLFQGGINPKILHWGLSPASEYDSCRLIVHQDNGFTTPEMLDLFREVMNRGGGVVSLLNDGAGPSLFAGNARATQCQSFRQVIGEGYRCRHAAENGRRGFFYHVNEAFYWKFNSDLYGEVEDVPERLLLLKGILADLGIQPRVSIQGGGDRVVVFARRSQDGTRLWVTAKTGQLKTVHAQVLWSEADPQVTYKVTDVLSGHSQILNGKRLRQQGFHLSLAPTGSTAFMVEPQPSEP
ncbi:MAG: beta-galactosidase [Bdellovibrionaceae bacterium]|nr:beta-galactosidase [Pseudobdellovibrionaceae bacterium]